MLWREDGRIARRATPRARRAEHGAGVIKHGREGWRGGETHERDFTNARQCTDMEYGHGAASGRRKMHKRLVALPGKAGRPIRGENPRRRVVAEVAQRYWHANEEGH